MDFQKKDLSWQGQIYFIDLNILFFPVFTMKGTKWITTASKLKEIGLNSISSPADENKIKTNNGNEGHLNLGWLYLEIEGTHSIRNENLACFNFGNFQLNPEDIVIVPESLFSHIVNSNLEVRTSVSIDPITGAAKEGALFTSEAIPRGTILYGCIRIFDKLAIKGIDCKIAPLPSINHLEQALNDSKHFYETLGIGGMTTRGFGRLKIILLGINLPKSVKMKVILKVQQTIQEVIKVNNIEAVISKASFEIVKEKILDENQINKLLGILSTDGVYAMWVYAKSQKDIDEKKLLEKLKEILSIGKPLPNDNYDEYFQSVSEDLPKLLFLKQLLEKKL